ncbi:L-cystine uptake protein TcyP [Oceanobacillus oncorhynchi subsp. incaldanensis]|uniref:L-cystine transporter n=1 Tax=Oceanobacillus oncorhynchi TaxID=545501 RepID=UPI001B10A514|nr:L-cystine transporter [Oceanobacillus oncorhynchi]GIO18046.1 L-cystine uptake protein TcyP [Oceanobacillus oncorhynchi subsp. incaldanensis]
MDNWFVLLNIVVLVALIGLLIYMQKKHVSFAKRVFTGMGIGIVLGALFQVIYGEGSDVLTSTLDWYDIVGSGYIRFLMLIVVPLVMVSIIRAIINLNETKQLGKMAAWVIGVLISTTLVAATLGVVTSLVFDLNAEQIEAGQEETERGASMQENFESMEEETTPQRIINFIPNNIFLDMTGERSTSVIAVVIFSVLVGIATLGVSRKQPEQAERFTRMVNAVFAIVMRLVTLILRLTPFGVLALMTNMVATTNFAGIVQLGKFVIASYVALIVMVLIHMLIVSGFKLNPITFMKKVFPVLGFAFTSRSSAGAIPLNVTAQKEALGVDDGAANMSASFGATMGQNACAGIYPAMLAVMIAPTVGIDPTSLDFIVQLVLITAISSFGVAGVGGGATFAAIIVLSSMGLPIALAGLLITVEPLIDMGRTAVNVNGSMVSGTVTSKVLGNLDEKKFNNKDAVVENTGI